MTLTDAQAAAAIRAHHAELAAEIRRRALAVAAAGGTVETAGDLLDFLDQDLLPHALAEEQALYPAGDSGMTALLVRAMRDEHVGLIAHVDALRGASGVEAIGISRAILALFESHLHKENDLLIPALADEPDVSLADLLSGMHELLGSPTH
jgi:iron-sulfur cluster repair protein YtfE (RIC family)